VQGLLPQGARASFPNRQPDRASSSELPVKIELDEHDDSGDREACRERRRTGNRVNEIKWSADRIGPR